MFDAGRKNFGFSRGENGDLGTNCASGIDEKILDFLLEATGILKSLIQDRSRKNNFWFDGGRKNIEFSSPKNMIMGPNCDFEIDGKFFDFLLETTGILKFLIQDRSRKNNFLAPKIPFYADKLSCEQPESIPPPPGYGPRTNQFNQHPQPTHILQLLHQIHTTRTQNSLRSRRTGSLMVHESFPRRRSGM